MEYPVPDLIYYQRIVDLSIKYDYSADILRTELQDLIEDVQIYLSEIQRRKNNG